MTQWQNKKVAVTGAGGFIGSHLAETLVRQGAGVRALVRYNSAGSWGWLDHSDLAGDMEITPGNVKDKAVVDRLVKGVDVVFHLAALISIPYSYQAVQSYIQTNIEGTANVLSAALEAGCRLVHTSTSEVYGTARTVPIDEGHVLQAQSPYSATKIAADKLAESYNRSFGLPVLIVRPFNTYGPRQSARAVIPTVITQALSGDEIRLGNLAPTRDFNFVLDTAAGFIAAALAEKAVGQVVNIGAGREYSIGQVVETIIRLTGSSARILHEEQRMRPEDSEVDRLLADNTRAREELGWTPAYSLEQGLLETIAWFRDNLGRYKSHIYNY